MICSWLDQGQIDGSDDEHSEEKEPAGIINDKGQLSTSMTNRMAWGNASFSSEDDADDYRPRCERSESVLWRGVDFQLDLLDAMDEADKDTICPSTEVHIKSVNSSHNDAKLVRNNNLGTPEKNDINSLRISMRTESSKQQTRPSRSSLQNNCNETLNPYQEEPLWGHSNPCYINGRVNNMESLQKNDTETNNSDSENEINAFLASAESKSLASKSEATAGCYPSTATEILAIVGAQRERRKSTVSSAVPASMTFNKLLERIDSTPKVANPVGDKVCSNNSNPTSFDTESKDSEDEVNRLASAESQTSSLAAKPEATAGCHPSTATEILAVVGAQRERRRSTVASAIRASMTYNDFLERTDSTRKVANPVGDKVCSNNSNPISFDTESKDSEDEVSRFLASAESQTSFVAAKPEAPAGCHPSTATEILAVVGAQRERRRSTVAGVARASIVVNKILVKADDTRKVANPVGDKVCSNINIPLSFDAENKDSDSEDEVSKFLGTFSLASKPEEGVCHPSTATEILAVVGAQRERRKSAVAVRAGMAVNQLLGMADSMPKVSNPVGDQVYSNNNILLSLDADNKDSDSEDEVSRFLASSELKASSSASKPEETGHSRPSKAAEILAVVGAQRERRKSTVAAAAVRASMAMSQRSGLVDTLSNTGILRDDTANPNYNKLHPLEGIDMGKGGVVSEDVNRLLGFFYPDNSLVSNRGNFKCSSPTAKENSNLENVKGNQLLALGDRPKVCIPEDNNKVSSNDTEHRIQVNPENNSASDASCEDKEDLGSTTLEQRRLERNRKMEDELPELSGDQMLTAVAAQKERRKMVVDDVRRNNDNRTRRRGSPSWDAEVTVDDEVDRAILPETDENNKENGTHCKFRGSEDEEDDSTYLGEVELDSFLKQKFGASYDASSRLDQRTEESHRPVALAEHNIVCQSTKRSLEVSLRIAENHDAEFADEEVKKCLNSNSNDQMTPEHIGAELHEKNREINPTSLKEAKLFAAVASQREKRRSVVSNIRKNSDDRCRRRNSLSLIKEITLGLEETPNNLNRAAPENMKDQNIARSEAIDAKQTDQENDAELDEAALDSFLEEKFGFQAKDIHHTDNNTKESSIPGSDIATKKLHSSNIGSSAGISGVRNKGPGAIIAVQLLMCALASRVNKAARDGMTAQNVAFSYFSLLSVNASFLSTAARDEGAISDAGSAYLDPFIVKSANLIDQFPPVMAPSQKGLLSPAALSTFCLPNGILIRFFPKCAAAGAKRMGWFGTHSERYQVHSFTDEKGELSNGISIITREELSCETVVAAQVVAEFQRRRKKRRAGRIITRWCCELYHSIAGGHDWAENQMRFGGRRHSSAPEQGAVITGRPGLIRNIKRLLLSKPSERSLNTASNSTLNRKNIKRLSAPSSRDGSYNGRERLYRNGSLCSSINDCNSLEVDFTLSSKNNGATMMAASQAYKFMIDAEKLGEVCIVERCYILVGTKCDDHALLFYALHLLLETEREDVTIQQLSATNTKFIQTPQKNNGLRRLSFGINILNRESSNRAVDVPPSEFSKEQRHSIISYMQKTLMIPPEQSAIISSLKSEQEYLDPEPNRFEFTLPYGTFGKTSMKLPLPSVTREWGLSMLLLRIKAPALLVVLKLLLLERSVLVIGRTFEEVTICTSALRDLLEPYQWASAFIPLLPVEMIDFVSAPVPFIAGVVVEDGKNLHNLERDFRVKDAVSSGLSIVNLLRSKVRVTSEPEIAELVGNTGCANLKLIFYQKRLEELAFQESSAFHSFRLFFTHGLSFRERLTLKSMRSLIKEELLSLTTICTDIPEDWGPYGELDESSTFFDFSSAKFIDGVMFKMLSQFKYLEIMSQTQLFLGYVDSRRQRTLQFAKRFQGSEACFIALWLNFRWRRYSEKRRRNSLVTSVVSIF